MSDEVITNVQGQTPAPRREERLLAKPGFTFLPQSWEQLFAYAKEICQTDFTPKSMRGSPGAVLAAWQKGSEVGMQPMASLQSIAVINGVTSIHSDGYWALVVNSPLCESFEELEPAECIAKGYGECTIKRRGNPTPIKRRFTMEMAKTAKLVDKDNWKNYPGRMLQQRARHLAGNDAVPEATQGLVPSDIASDFDEPRDVTPIRTPQAITEKPKDDDVQGNQNQGVRGSGDSTSPVRGDTKLRADAKARTPKSGQVAPSGDTQTTPANTAAVVQDPPAEQGKALDAEKTQDDWIKECLLWIENMTIEQANDDDSWLMHSTTGAVKQLKGTKSQMAVLIPFNNRKQELAKEAKQ